MVLRQKSALITGAASGIGAALTESFLNAGYHVALFDIDAEAAANTAAKKTSPFRALVLQGDAADEEQVRNAAARMEAEFGQIDVLINNVGIEINGTVIEQTVEQWDRQFAVNLRSIFLFSKYVVPVMQRRGGGSIVNISSVHAFVSWPRCAAYDATKAGVIGVTRALALDHGKEGIRVNAICPGYIRTPLLEQVFGSGNAGEQAVLRYHPLGRIGTPQDVANAALFLASDAASFITGTSLTVDGGLTISGH